MMSADRMRTLVLAALLPFACNDPQVGPDPGLPSFGSSQPLSVGVILSVTGPLAPRTATLERAALLTEDFINGHVRAYPGVAPDQIPCRKAGTCGVWAGRDGAGKPLRARLKLVIADSSGRVDKGVQAARELVSRERVGVIVGPCAADEAVAIQKEVTKTDVTLVSPVVTADALTAIADRNPAEAPDAPGYVFRTMTPDYIQARVLAQLATNLEDPPPLLRFEDQTADECTNEDDPAAFCEAKRGKGYQCLASTHTDTPERVYDPPTTTTCTSDKACEDLGKSYECRSGVCTRFRVRRYCTKVVTPRAAVVLYPDDETGRALKTTVEGYWEGKQLQLLASGGFDPNKPGTFSGVLSNLFTTAQAKLTQAIAEGKLPADYPLEDTIAFFLGGEVEGALLFQEWRTQIPRLPKGADRVFWLGTARLLTRTFIDLIQFDTVRNLYVTQPYTTDATDYAFFEKLYKDRYGSLPGDYSATLFDTLLLVTLAIERAGSAGTGNGPASAATIKNSLPIVSVGCARTKLEPCPSGSGIEVFHSQALSDALTALQAGKNVRLQGLTGDLSLSPEGDRVSDIQVLRVKQVTGGKQFFTTRSYSPATLGIYLEK